MRFFILIMTVISLKYCYLLINCKLRTNGTNKRFHKLQYLLEFGLIWKTLCYMVIVMFIILTLNNYNNNFNNIVFSDIYYYILFNFLVSLLSKKGRPTCTHSRMCVVCLDYLYIYFACMFVCLSVCPF